MLTIDGLQPEKGHETLYVVRELKGKRVWFAQALLSTRWATSQMPQRGMWASTCCASACFGGRIRLASRVQGMAFGMDTSASFGDEGDDHSSAVRPVTAAT